MSVSGVSSNNFFDYNSQGIQSRLQQFQQQFQQLGQDLQSGNLSAAQSDFATLQQYGPQANSTSTTPTSSTTTQSNNPIAQAFNQLSQDLQSGNLSAAQQDYTQIQQDFQNQASSQNQQTHHHHHHGGGSGGSGSGSQIQQLFDQLGQALQSGNLSTAQQAYSTLQQDFQQFSQNNGLTSPSQSSSSNVSVNA